MGRACAREHNISTSTKAEVRYPTHPTDDALGRLWNGSRYPTGRGGEDAPYGDIGEVLRLVDRGGWLSRRAPLTCGRTMAAKSLLVKYPFPPEST